MPTQTLLPDALLAHAGWAGSPVIGTIDEDPDTAGGDWLDPVTASGSGSSSPTARVSFPTPTGPPSGVQTFKARLGLIDALGTSPTARIDLYEAGALKASGAAQTISTTKASAGQVISQTFDLATTPLTTANGSGVEALVVVTAAGGKASSQRSASLDSVNWDTVTYSAPDTTAPAVPSGLAATPGNTQVALSWAANAESDLAGYRLYRGGVQVYDGAASTYLDSSVVNGTTYSYTVAAYDTASNESAPSAGVQATPTGTGGTAPVFRSVATGQRATSGSEVTVPKPAGLQVGDLLVGHVSSDEPGGALAAPTGWTEHWDILTPGGTTGDHQSAVYSKVAVQADVDAASFTFTSAATTGGAVGAIVAYQAGTFDPAAPIHQVAGQGNTGATQSHTTPTVTTTLANCLVLAFFSVDGTATITEDFGVSGATERYDVSESGQKISQAGFEQTPAAGAISVTATSLNTRRSVAGILAIAPSTSGDTTPPVTTLGTPTRTTISAVAGWNTTDVTITANEAFVEYMLRRVPAETSTRTEGTLIETATIAATTSLTATITNGELAGVEGPNLVKAFTRDAAGNWSTS